MKSVGDLQKAIFYCMENYDNWRNLPVIYQKDISKDKSEGIAFHADIDELRYDDDLFIFTSAHAPGDLTLSLESISDMIDEVRNNEENWMTKTLKFETPIDFEFETTENVIVRSDEDFNEIKDFFVNEECFMLIGE